MINETSQVALVVKNPPANAGDRKDMGLILALGRSREEGEGNTLQYSCLGNPMDRGAWWATVHSLASQGSNPGLPHCRQILYQLSYPGSRVAKSWTRLKQLSALTHTHTHTQLLNSVVLVSDVQPSDSVTHIHVSILCEALSPFRLFQNTEQSSLCFQWVFVGYPFKIVFIKSGSKTPSL